MGAFDLDFASLCAVVAPDRIPLHGNEHRITRVAFDLFKMDGDKESLWQVQADDDGNEFLVRTYELPKDESIQAKSDWDVALDSRKASLTVSYRGMPIHRMVAADYGAQNPSDAAMLCDLVQAKLADDRFASRMIAALPESKRAALLTTFPKFATDMPKILQIGGSSDSIPSSDPEKHSQMVKDDAPCWKCGDVHAPREGCGEADPGAGLKEDSDPWSEKSFTIDMGRPQLREEAKSLVPKVMAYLEARSGKDVSLQTLYKELDVNDIPLYMALHALVRGGLINGISLYDTPSPEMAALTGQKEWTHADYFYSVGKKKLQNAFEGR